MEEQKSLTIRILVTMHKPYRVPEDAMYLPIHVGAALHSKVLPGVQRDDEGDNISEKNPLYCELTGLYWAWKNLDADYVGIAHYRRHFGWKPRMHEKDPFDRVVREKDIMPLFGQIRVFLPKKRRYVIETLYSHYSHTHYMVHLDETRRIIAELYPEYLSTYDRVLKQTSGYMFNMVIMERKLLDQYCGWLFRILGELEKRIDTSGLSYYQGRYCGRVGEIIFNVWLAFQLEKGTLQKKEVRVLPYVLMEKPDYPKKIRAFLSAKFLHLRYER